MQDLKRDYAEVTERLAKVGLRPTRQRILLGALLFSQGCRHVSAEMLHSEAKAANIQVSLATVYNTLHQFTEAGLLHEIMVDSGKSFFDTNCEPHHHFLYEESGMLEDVCATKVEISNYPAPPRGKVQSVDVIIRVREAG